MVTKEDEIAGVGLANLALTQMMFLGLIRNGALPASRMKEMLDAALLVDQQGTSEPNHARQIYRLVLQQMLDALANAPG